MHGEEGLRLIRGERERVEGEGKGDGPGERESGGGREGGWSGETDARYSIDHAPISFN